jgi:hypothetical protein
MTPFSVTFGNVLLMLLYLLPGFFMCKIKKIKPDHLSSVSVILLYICGFGLYVNALSHLDPSPELFAKMGLFLLIALAGETAEEGARREMKEETGLEAGPLEQISVTHWPGSKSVIYAYLAVVDCAKDAVVLQEGETVDYMWVDYPTLMKLIAEDEVLQVQYPRYKPYLDQLES